MIRVSVGLVTACAVALAVSACQQPSSTPPAAAPTAQANAADPEPGVQVSALAPANIARVKAAGAPPWDLTGNWFIDTEGGQTGVPFVVPTGGKVPVAVMAITAVSGATGLIALW